MDRSPAPAGVLIERTPATRLVFKLWRLGSAPHRVSAARSTVGRRQSAQVGHCPLAGYFEGSNMVIAALLGKMMTMAKEYSFGFAERTVNVVFRSPTRASIAAR